MLHGRTLRRTVCLLVVAASCGGALAFWPPPARAQVDGEHYTPGNACPAGDTPGQGVSADWDTFFECNGSSKMQRGPYFFGSTSDTCDSNHAGMVQWTGSGVSPNNTFEFCNGSSWISVSGAAALSSITAATGSASIDSGANAITWAWNSIASGIALALTSTDMTSGTILEVENTYGANSTGKMVFLEDVTTGAGYALYALTTGSGNTGYAGYFTNAATSGANYGLYGTDASASGYGGYFTNSGNGWALDATGTSYFNGSVGVGVTAPVDKLDVNGALGIYGGNALNLYKTGNSVWAYINMDSSQELVIQNGNGNEVLNAFGNINLSTWNGSAYSNALTVTTTQSVGIGTASPQAALDVNGAARVGSTGASCSSSNAGAVQYTGGVFEGCNGSSWVKFPGMGLISTQTASNSASLSWTGLSTAYNTYLLDCNGLVPATEGNTLTMELGEGATPTWENGNYYFASAMITEAGGGDGGAGTIYYYKNSGTAASIDLTYGSNVGSGSATGISVSSKVWISNVGSSSLYKEVSFSSAWMQANHTQRANYGSGSYQGDTNAITALKVYMSVGGNITSGQCSLYGLAN